LRTDSNPANEDHEIGPVRGMYLVLLIAISMILGGLIGERLAGDLGRIVVGVFLGNLVASFSPRLRRASRTSHVVEGAFNGGFFALILRGDGPILLGVLAGMAAGVLGGVIGGLLKDRWENGRRENRPDPSLSE
jgi:hypothetical protein